MKIISSHPERNDILLNQVCYDVMIDALDYYWAHSFGTDKRLARNMANSLREIFEDEWE